MSEIISPTHLVLPPRFLTFLDLRYKPFFNFVLNASGRQTAKLSRKNVKGVRICAGKDRFRLAELLDLERLHHFYAQLRSARKLCRKPTHFASEEDLPKGRRNVRNLNILNRVE